MARHRGATRRLALATLAGAASLAMPALAQQRPFLLALTPVLMTSDLDLLGLLRGKFPRRWACRCSLRPGAAIRT